MRDAVGPVIGANVDPSHMFWQQMDPIAVIRALGPAVHHVHLKDTEYRDEKSRSPACSISGPSTTPPNEPGSSAPSAAATTPSSGRLRRALATSATTTSSHRKRRPRSKTPSTESPTPLNSSHRSCTNNHITAHMEVLAVTTSQTHHSHRPNLAARRAKPLASRRTRHVTQAVAALVAIAAAAACSSTGGKAAVHLKAVRARVKRTLRGRRSR